MSRLLSFGKSLRLAGLFIPLLIVFVDNCSAQGFAFPRPVLQTGQTQQAWSMALSPNNETLATASGHAIDLWDPVNGWLLATLVGHKTDVQGIAFSPDGKTLASVSANGELATWDVATGKRESLRHVNDQQLESVAYRSSTEIVTAGWDQEIRIWDQSGCAASCVIAEVGAYPTALSLSVDKVYLAVGTAKNAVSLWRWDNKSLSKIRDLELPVTAGANGHDSHVRSVQFDQHNHLAAVNFEGTVILQDIDTWKTVWTQQTGLRLDGAVFDPKGELLYVAGSGAAFAGRVLSYRVVDGTRKPLYELTDQGALQNPFRSAAISSDGHWLYACGGWIARWDITKQIDPTLFGTHSVTASGYSTSLSPHATFIATASLGMHAFSIPHSRFTYGQYDPEVLKLLQASLHPPAQSEDERFIAVHGLNPDFVKNLQQKCGTRDKPDFLECASKVTTDTTAPSPYAILLFQSATLKFEKVISSADFDSRYLFSSDDKYLFWTHGHNLSSIELECLCNVREFDGIDLPVDEGFFDIAINQRGDTVAFPKRGTNGGVIQLFSLTNNAKGMDVSLPEPRVWLRSLAFSPQDTGGHTSHFAVGSSSGVVYLFDTTEPDKSHQIPGDSPAERLVYSHDGNLLAIARENGSVTIVRTSTLEKVEISQAHTSSITDIKFGFANRWLASVGTDGTIKFWNCQDGADLGTLLVRNADFGRLSWIFLRPDGLFEGEPAAFSSVMWRFSAQIHDIAPVEIFFKDYYRQGLMKSVLLDGAKPQAKPLSQINRSIPSVTISTDAPQDKALATESARVHVHVSEALDTSGKGSGIKDVRLFRNGTLIKHWHQDFSLEATLDFDAPVSTGANQFSAYAFNHDNVKSLDAHLNLIGGPSLLKVGTRYILAIGVGQYASPIPILRYTTNDAKSFADSIGRNYDPKRLVSVVLTDGEATEENIRCGLSRLEDAQFSAEQLCRLEKLNALRHARLEDSVFVLFSGHGMSNRGHFFALPVDAALVGQGKVSHAISDQVIADMFEPILASQIVLVLDACGSGQLLPPDANELGPLNVDGLAQLAYDKGMNILAATTLGQAAMESPDNSQNIKHSILNYVMIDEGLNAQKADLSPKDGIITVEELFDYATSHVPNEADQQPQAFFPMHREGARPVVVTSR